MKARYVQKGNLIDYTPTSAVAAGDVVILGTLCGIANLDIPANTLGALALTGVFEIVKATGAITVGAKVYWDNSAKNVTTTASSNTAIGVAFAEAGSSDATVLVRIN